MSQILPSSLQIISMCCIVGCGSITSPCPRVWLARSWSLAWSLSRVPFWLKSAKPGWTGTRQGHPKHMLDIVCHIRSFSFNSHTQTFALQRRSLRIVLEEKQGWLRSRAVSLGNELSVTGRQAHFVVIDHRCSFFDPCWVDHTSGYT
jgi:hypothetical protein